MMKFLLISLLLIPPLSFSQYTVGSDTVTIVMDNPYYSAKYHDFWLGLQASESNGVLFPLRYGFGTERKKYAIDLSAQYMLLVGALSYLPITSVYKPSMPANVSVMQRFYFSNRDRKKNIPVAVNGYSSNWYLAYRMEGHENQKLAVDFGLDAGYMWENLTNVKFDGIAYTGEVLSLEKFNNENTDIKFQEASSYRDYVFTRIGLSRTKTVVLEIDSKEYGHKRASYRRVFYIHGIIPIYGKLDDVYVDLERVAYGTNASVNGRHLIYDAEEDVFLRLNIDQLMDYRKLGWCAGLSFYSPEQYSVSGKFEVGMLPSVRSNSWIDSFYFSTTFGIRIGKYESFNQD